MWFRSLKNLILFGLRPCVYASCGCTDGFGVQVISQISKGSIWYLTVFFDLGLTLFIVCLSKVVIFFLKKKFLPFVRIGVDKVKRFWVFKLEKSCS